MAEYGARGLPRRGSATRSPSPSPSPSPSSLSLGGGGAGGGGRGYGAYSPGNVWDNLVTGNATTTAGAPGSASGRARRSSVGSGGDGGGGGGSRQPETLPPDGVVYFDDDDSNYQQQLWPRQPYTAREAPRLGLHQMLSFLDPARHLLPFVQQRCRLESRLKPFATASRRSSVVAADAMPADSQQAVQLSTTDQLQGLPARRRSRRRRRNDIRLSARGESRFQGILRDNLAHPGPRRLPLGVARPRGLREEAARVTRRCRRRRRTPIHRGLAAGSEGSSTSTSTSERQ
jgi:hypothetical protein